MQQCDQEVIVMFFVINSSMAFVKFDFTSYFVCFVSYFCVYRVKFCLPAGVCRRRLKHRVDNVVAESVALPTKANFAKKTASSASSRGRSYYSPTYYSMQSARSMPMILYETRV